LRPRGGIPEAHVRRRSPLPLNAGSPAHRMTDLAHLAGITNKVGPHALRHAFITAALDAGSRCAMCKRRPLIRIRPPRCDTTGVRPASAGLDVLRRPPVIS
jgi:hypothetical protein